MGNLHWVKLHWVGGKHFCKWGLDMLFLNQSMKNIPELPVFDGVRGNLALEQGIVYDA